MSPSLMDVSNNNSNVWLQVISVKLDTKKILKIYGNFFQNVSLIMSFITLVMCVIQLFR